MPRQIVMGAINERPEHQRRRGMRQVRIWLPDTSTPEFQAEAHRQAVLLRGAPEEAEALDFIEKVGDFTDE
jgi:hypothetical protein